ncbi:MAG: Flp pilus assembly complex ATPase component TadA, partial [Pyramidobacter sp.]|nr:Flp pilus assembly complex ATPase component TadA [Pyramidobacter sp.]
MGPNTQKSAPEELAQTHFSPSPQALSLLSYDAARRLGVLPLEVAPTGRLIALCVRPDDMLVTDELRMLCRVPVELRASPLPSLDGEIERAYQFSGAVARLAEEGSQNLPSAEKSADVHDDSSPAAGIVERIIAQALRERASDIHIEPTEVSTRVRFRIDGHLTTALEMPLTVHPSVTARVKIMAGMDIAEKRVPQDGRIHREA